MHHDITVHRVVKSSKRAGQYIEPHIHAFFHFIYGLDGHLQVQVGAKRIQTKPGILVMVPPGVEHSVASLDISISLDIKFSCSSETAQIMAGLPTAAGPLNDQAGCLLRCILDEAIAQSFGYEEMVNLRLYELLICLKREVCGTFPPRQDVQSLMFAPKDKNIRRVLQVIEDNLEQRLAVSWLAEQFGYSENYFRSYFKRQMGLSPNRYISYRKISRAKELMLCSNLNVSQIAERLGYQSIHYFSRQFHKMTGISPSTYAARMHGDRPINIVHNQNTPVHEFELPLREAAPRPALPGEAAGERRTL